MGTEAINLNGFFIGMRFFISAMCKTITSIINSFIELTVLN